MAGLPVLVVQRAKDAGCQAWRENGNITIEELVNFVAENPKLTEGMDGALDPRLQKAWDTFEGRMTKRQKRLERARQLVPVEQLNRALGKNIIACKTKLYATENTAAVEIGMKLGMDRDKTATVKEILMKHIRQAVRELHAGEWGTCLCPHCKTEL